MKATAIKTSDVLLLTLLAAIWGSSFIFMRASAEAFGPIALIAIRIIIASLCLALFLFKKERKQEFIDNWRTLAWVGIISSSLPFCLLAYASLSLTGGTVSILNAMTPIFTAWIAHLWLKDSMSKLQFIGLVISILGLIILVWDKVSWDFKTWWPILAGVLAAFLYGVASNSMKKYLSHISIMTKTAGSIFFAALFMLILLPFFLPDLTTVKAMDWINVTVLGVICTALAYFIFFRLINNIGPARSASVTFLVPIFSFLFGYLFLGETVTIRMWGAIIVILLGMSLVLRLVNFKST